MDYITFVLGYDLLHDYFELFEDAPCDSVHEICCEIAREFIRYDVKHPTNTSMYEALEAWIDSHKEFVWDRLWTLGKIKECYMKDFIFKAGKVHGNADELCLVYFNPDSSVPSWEILYISHDLVLTSYKSECGYYKECAEDFMDTMMSCAHGYWSNDPSDYVKMYPLADFHDTGDVVDEVEFIRDWAMEV